MTMLEYSPGKFMAFAPKNIVTTGMVELLQHNQPLVVILEPGDATRYTLLLVPAASSAVGRDLSDFGIVASQAHRYIFVSKLSSMECQGSWLPFGPGVVVEPHDIVYLSDNQWSQTFLAWWFTELNKLL